MLLWEWYNISEVQTGLENPSRVTRDRLEIDSASAATSLQIIATIFAKLQNPADVLAAAMVNRSMLRIASEAALKLRMEPSQMEQTGQSFLSDGQKHFAGAELHCLANFLL